MIKVSVCCITYNHERFLAQAIESVLMQQTDFEVELVIGEDCSTDSTRAIVVDYQQRYPGRIRALLPTTNQGIMVNLFNTLNACKGEYIALLEGDDYWTDPQKLALQVAVLEQQPECVLCIHDAEVFADDGSKTPHPYSSLYPELLSAEQPIVTQQDLVMKNWGMPTASMLFRRSATILPEWYKGVYSGDYTLQLLLTQYGYIYYLPRVMSRYRHHEASVSQATHRNKSVGIFDKKVFELKQYQKMMPQYAKRYESYLQYWYFERSLLKRKQKAYVSGWLDYARAVLISPDTVKKWLFRSSSK
jgi:glycosyltransferase involved in cell wall biosynthesis